MIEKKTFLLGAGCQKGGTTWLHRYLHAHPHANMGMMKEYHIFDALFVPECKKFLDPSTQKETNFFQKRSGFLSDIESYFDYFQALARESDLTFLTGDITPSYAALPVEALATIKAGMERRQLKVKVMFLMRDPVERCLSAVRMQYRKAGIPPSLNEETDWVLKSYQTRDFQIRTRYQDTIKNLESVFDPADIHYDFYEELFTQESMQKITTFLSVPYITPAFEKTVKVSKTDNEIDKETRREVATFYRETYAFVAEKFGHSKIGSLWKHYGLSKLPSAPVKPFVNRVAAEERAD